MNGADGSPDREHLLDSLMSISRALIAITVRSLAAAGAELTFPQYRILVVLAGRGPQRTIDLAVEQAVRPSTISRACDRLIRRGLVSRYQAPPDRRVAWLALTEAGRELIGEVMRHRRDEFDRLIATVEIPHVPAAAAVIEALARATGEPDEAEWWRRWAAAAGGPDRCRPEYAS
ncbi:MAG TPA: MarR family transcriptional regulator [Micromonosporaceae bacterium]